MPEPSSRWQRLFGTQRRAYWVFGLGATVIVTAIAGLLVASLTPPPGTNAAAPPSSATGTPGPDTTVDGSSPAPTEAGSPTSTGGVPATGQTGCFSQPSACGYPDATNTGARGSLQVINGDVTLETAGQVFADREVRGCIVVTAPDVVIRNVRVLGSCTYAIDHYPDGGGTLTIEDTTVVCGNPRGTAIGEWQLVVRRVDVSGCENGFDLDRDTVIVDSYCHDLTSEHEHPDAHTDCVQGLMTEDVTIEHSTLIAPRAATSAIEGDCGTCDGITRVRWVVRANLLTGGQWPLYCTIRSTENGSIVESNRFGTGNIGYAEGCTDGVTWRDNVADATGEALPAT
jgi:hypothetical protein